MTQPSNLRDELASDQSRKTQCGVCQWINQQNDAADWKAVIADKSFTHASIYRALQRRDVHVGRGAIEMHRLNNHA